MGKALEIGQTLGRLKQYSSELNIMIEDGSFYRLSFLERHKLVRRVKKLYNRLLGPVSALKLRHVLAAAGVVALNTACFGPTAVLPGLIIIPGDDPGSSPGGAPSLPSLIPYFSHYGPNPYGIRPLGGEMNLWNPDEHTYSMRFEFGTGYAFVDMDGDGDLDIVHTGGYINFSYNYYDESATLSSYGAKMVWQENTGTPEEPEFGPHMPFPVDTVQHVGSIGFADMDNDGDQDLWMATGTLRIPYLEFFGLEDQQYIDGDGLAHFKNVGSEMAPEFEFQGTSGSVEPPDPWAHQDVAIGDVDADGDMDILVGTRNGIAFYRNTGTPENPQFNFSSPDFSALGLDEVTDYSEYAYQLALVDVDGDGDLDLAAIGEFGHWNPDGYGGYFFSTDYFNAAVVALNDGDGLNPNLINVFVPSGLYTESWPLALSPRAVDIDADGDLDVFSFGPERSGGTIEGDYYSYYYQGQIFFHENLVINEGLGPR